MSKSSTGMQIVLSSISSELRRRVDKHIALWTAIKSIINQRIMSDIDQLQGEYESE